MPTLYSSHHKTLCAILGSVSENVQNDIQWMSVEISNQPLGSIPVCFSKDEGRLGDVLNMVYTGLAEKRSATHPICLFPEWLQWIRNLERKHFKTVNFRLTTSTPAIFIRQGQV